MKNINKALLQDCIDMSDAMATAACGIVALGELMIAADPQKVEEFTLSGLGHVLATVGGAMLDDSDRGSKTARSALKTKRVRAALS